MGKHTLLNNYDSYKTIGDEIKNYPNSPGKKKSRNSLIT